MDPRDQSIVSRIVPTILAGEWTAAGISDRAAELDDSVPIAWRERLIWDLAVPLASHPPPTESELTDWLIGELDLPGPDATDRELRLASELAIAILAGAWTAEAIRARIGHVVGRVPASWRRWLIPSLLLDHAETPRPGQERLAAWLAAQRSFLSALDRSRPDRQWLRRRWLAPAAMARAPGSWPVRPLTTALELVDWLELDDVAQLEWLADWRGLERQTAAGGLRRYDYHWRPRKGRPPRLIEAPRPRLKRAQRRILDDVLNHIPTHDAAHGFVRGRSLVSYLRPHVQQRCVIHLDLRDFFGTISAPRINGLFRLAGYPEPIARLLAGLTTNRAPWAVVGRSPIWRLRRHYVHRHLPQGAPSSPALANLTSYPLDCRLDGLARATGCVYTRYGDDLTLSGPLGRKAAGRRVEIIARILRDEGFTLHPDKTRIMPRSGRQQVAGVVLNEGLRLRRDVVDRLKATLHNGATRGPAACQDVHPRLREHLTGRVAWLMQIDPVRGARMRELLDRIDWEPA